MEKVAGKIENANVYRISELFRKRPRGVGIGLTDAVVIEAKTEDGREIKETMYCRLKADGTFTTSVIGHNIRGKQERIANFIKYYKLAENVKGYNIREKISEWKGKEVKIVPYKDGGYIYVP
ncbi:MAG: hypothetical protein AB1779_02600 [Candidatus Thermoplasmatota archaeon]